MGLILVPVKSYCFNSFIYEFPNELTLFYYARVVSIKSMLLLTAVMVFPPSFTLALITLHTALMRPLFTAIGPCVSPPLQRRDVPQSAADESTVPPSRCYVAPALSQHVINIPVSPQFLSVMIWRFSWLVIPLNPRCPLHAKRESQILYNSLPTLHTSAAQSVITVRVCAPCTRFQSSDASRCCDRATELISRLLLRLLRAENETAFHRELRDLAGGNLSAVSFLNTINSFSVKIFELQWCSSSSVRCFIKAARLWFSLNNTTRWLVAPFFWLEAYLSWHCSSVSLTLLPMFAYSDLLWQRLVVFP